MTTTTKHPGEVATYRGWAIIKNNDGYIALDPNGSNCIPGGGSHDNEKDARKSIDNYILAAGDPHLFHLLWGQGGWDLYASQGSESDAKGNVSNYIAKRDNEKYEPSFEYKHVVNVAITDGNISLESSEDLGHLTPDSALALANVLRRAAIQAIRAKRGDKYIHV